MAKLNYQYQAGSRMRPPRRDGSGKLRLLLIFVVTALITAGIIFWLVPRKAAETPDAPVTDSEVRSAEAERTAVSSGEKDEVPVPPAAGEEEKKETEEKSAVSETPAEERIAEKPAEKPAGEKFTPNDFPEKGKPWKGDPPETPPAVPESGENSAAWRSDARALTGKHLSYINKRGDVPGFSVRHRVKSGESFSKIAAKYHTTYEMIKLLSGFSAKHNTNFLNVGRNLRILPGPWHIVIEKEAKLLKLYTQSKGNDELFAVWDIGIGRQNSTPTGEFVILYRIANPPWTAPDGSIIAFGKPENPLGTRFLKLARKETPTTSANGLGIHGTNDDSSVTKSLSSGCIRMKNSDVEMLFSIVPVRSRVTIRN